MEIHSKCHLVSDSKARLSRSVATNSVVLSGGDRFERCLPNLISRRLIRGGGWCKHSEADEAGQMAPSCLALLQRTFSGSLPISEVLHISEVLVGGGHLCEKVGTIVNGEWIVNSCSMYLV